MLLFVKYCEVLIHVVVCEVLSNVVVCEVLSHVVAQSQEVEGRAEEATQKDTQTVDSTEGCVTVSGSVSLCHNSKGSELYYVEILFTL